MRLMIRWSLLLLCGLVCWHAVSCPSGPPGPAAVVPTDESILKGASVKNFDPLEEREIGKAILPLLAPPCTEKFKAAGLRSPLEVITQTGIVIRPATDLHEYGHRELGLTSDLTRRKLWEEFSSCRAQAGTVYPTRNGVQLTTDERPIIFLHVSAFWGESFWLGKLSLHDVLTHEFIHAGGQPPTPGWFFFLHDLSGYEHYEEIMEACR